MGRLGKGSPTRLRPFWYYYGGKSRAAKHYPEPKYDTIIEPFAGAAGYSLRHSDRDIILVEKYHPVAEIWKYLISATPEEIAKIPPTDFITGLPDTLSDGAKFLVGMNFGYSSSSPALRASAGIISQRATRPERGWSQGRINLIATQVSKIKHWKIIEGDYTEIDNINATWFIDPPYNNKAGRVYKENNINYKDLSSWCRSRKGQVIVCEQLGADWLDFKPFKVLRSGPKTQKSEEVIWYKENPSPSPSENPQ